MGGGSKAKEHPYEYLLASAMAASINYPLWRASAIGQSGFRVGLGNSGTAGLMTMLPRSLAPYIYAFAPPYKGMTATIFGMTWARAAIFWGSDRGKEIIQRSFPSLPPSLHTLLPPLICSIGVQCVNQPLVRSSITLQNPESDIPNIRASLKKIYNNHGLKGLWHGTSAGILKTVPKYCTAVVVKDYMEEVLPPVDPSSPTHESDTLFRSALKSSAAGLAGATLTNPIDVIRNEMFKTNQKLLEALSSLHQQLGWKFLVRGMGKNLVAVSIPVACTIFFTDALIQFSTQNNNVKNSFDEEK